VKAEREAAKKAKAEAAKAAAKATNPAAILEALAAEPRRSWSGLRRRGERGLTCDLRFGS
jgi:hypothetical protein